MGGHLALFDASAYVYTAMNEASAETSYSNKTVQGYPVGGVMYLFKYILQPLMNLSDVLVLFDSRTDRKDHMPDYKAGRKGNHSVQSQLEYCYEKLLHCGIPAAKIDGFEADDLIYSAVQQNVGSYSRISIYGADYDLAHNVNLSVDLQPANRNVNLINVNNFKTAVQRGKNVMINTISAFKVFHGDSSDGIPSFTTQSGLTPDQLYTKYCEFLNNLFANKGFPANYIDITRDAKTFKVFLRDELLHKGIITAEEAKDLLTRVYVIYPRMVPDDVKLRGSGRDAVDFDKLQRIYSNLGDYRSLRTIRRDKLKMLDGDIEDFRRRADALKTGEFAADRNRPFYSTFETETQSMSLRDFLA